MYIIVRYPCVSSGREHYNTWHIPAGSYIMVYELAAKLFHLLDYFTERVAYRYATWLVVFHRLALKPPLLECTEYVLITPITRRGVTMCIIGIRASLLSMVLKKGTRALLLSWVISYYIATCSVIIIFTWASQLRECTDRSLGHKSCSEPVRSGSESSGPQVVLNQTL